jgi:hypothetical protein
MRSHIAVDGPVLPAPASITAALTAAQLTVVQLTVAQPYAVEWR